MPVRDIALSPTLSSEILYDFAFPITEAYLDQSFWNQVRPDGLDVRFEKIDGTPLAREVEPGFDPVAKKQVIWVRVPVFSPTQGATVRMRYGDGVSRPNSTAVWDSATKGAWHGKLNGTQLPDSTASGCHGTAVGIDGSNQIAMRVGQGLGLDGSTEYVNLNNISKTLLAGAAQITVSGTVKVTSSVAGDLIGSNRTGNPSLRCRFNYGTVANEAGKLRGLARSPTTGELSGYTTAATTVSDGQEHHVAYTFNLTTKTLRVLVDGQAVAITHDATTVGSSFGALVDSLFWGGCNSSSGLIFPFSGAIGQLRIVAANRSDAWLLAESRALSNPGGYYLVGAEQPDRYTLGAAQVLIAPDLAAGSLQQTHRLGAEDLAIAPALDTGPLRQTHRLGAADLSLPPALDTGPLRQTHRLGAADLVVVPTLAALPLVGETGLGDIINPELVSVTPARRFQSVTPARRFQSVAPRRSVLPLN